MATKIIRMLTVTAAATASLVVAMAGAAAVAPAFTYTVHVGSTPPGTLLHMTSYPVGSPPQFRVADTTNGMTLTCTSPPTLSDIIPGQYHSTDTGRLSSPGSLIQAPACDSAVSSARLYITLRITSMSTSPAAFRGVGSNGVFASLRFGDGCTFYLHGAQDFTFHNDYSTISFHGKSSTTPLTAFGVSNCRSRVTADDVFAFTGVFKVKAGGQPVTISSP